MHPHTFSDSTREGEIWSQFLALPRHSQPSQALRLLTSCQHHPIWFSFLRRRIGAANQISRGGNRRFGSAMWTFLYFFPPFHVLLLTLFCTHTFRDTLTRKRVAPGDGGLGERRMLAAGGPDPSPGSDGALSLPPTTERISQTITLKAFWVIPGPPHVPPGGRGRWAAHVWASPGRNIARAAALTPDPCPSAPIR